MAFQHALRQTPRERRLLLRTVHIPLECILVEYFISLLNRSLKLGGPFRPVECKARWPGDQIRWPRTNGPVLAPCLQNVTLLLYGVGVGGCLQKGHDLSYIYHRKTT